MTPTEKRLREALARIEACVELIEKYANEEKRLPLWWRKQIVTLKRIVAKEALSASEAVTEKVPKCECGHVSTCHVENAFEHGCSVIGCRCTGFKMLQATPADKCQMCGEDRNSPKHRLMHRGEVLGYESYYLHDEAGHPFVPVPAEEHQ